MPILFPRDAEREFLVSFSEKKLKKLEAFKIAVDTRGHGDAYLMKFLVARNFDVDKAAKMFNASQKLLRQYHFEDLMTTYTLPPRIQNNIPNGYFGIDRDGYPIIYESLGRYDPKGVVKVTSHRGSTQYKLWESAFSTRMLQMMTAAEGKFVDQLTYVFDLKGLGMSFFYQPFISFFTHLCDVYEGNFPESLHRLFVLNPPAIFPAAFAICKPFLNESTKQKFIILGSNKQKNYKTLVKYIDPKWLPQSLLGEVPDDECNDLNWGQPVPEADFIDSEKEMRGAQTHRVSKTDGLVLPIEVAHHGGKTLVEVTVHTSGSNVAVEFTDAGKNGEVLIPRETFTCTFAPETYSMLVEGPTTVHATFSITGRMFLKSKDIRVKVAQTHNPQGSTARHLLTKWMKVHFPQHMHLLDAPLDLDFAEPSSQPPPYRPPSETPADSSEGSEHESVTTHPQAPERNGAKTQKEVMQKQDQAREQEREQGETAVAKHPTTTNSSDGSASAEKTGSADPSARVVANRKRGKRCPSQPTLGECLSIPNIAAMHSQQSTPTSSTVASPSSSPTLEPKSPPLPANNIAQKSNGDGDDGSQRKKKLPAPPTDAEAYERVKQSNSQRAHQLWLQEDLQDVLSMPLNEPQSLQRTSL